MSQVSLADRARYIWFRVRQRLQRRRRGGWSGLSILIFRENDADRPASLRINYYLLVFFGLLAAAAPVAGGAVFMEESLRAAESERTVETRRALLNLMAMLTEEKQTLLARVEGHVEEFQRISRADAAGRMPPALPVHAGFLDAPGPAVDRPSQDLALLRRMNRRARDLLREDAHQALELIWHRMDINHSMPRGRPLPAGVGFITSVFGARPNPFQRSDTGSREIHSGVDFASAPGTPIVATASGRVIRAVEDTDSGYGKHVRIHHGYGYTSLYAHCRALAVEEGDFVRRGQVIGYLGRTGRATGNHVHYEVQLGLDPAIDPMEYVQLK